jgi:hypothetical protein
MLGKEALTGAVMLAQASIPAYEGVWYLGPKCDPLDTMNSLSIKEGVISGPGFACYMDNVRVRGPNAWNVIQRCYEGTAPAQTITFILEVVGPTLTIYDFETGKQHSKLAACPR